jgi:B12-binding domain/radical SAM domain protein
MPAAKLERGGVTLVVLHAGSGVHAFNVLTAALRADPSTAETQIRFAKDEAALVAACLAATEADGATAIAAWSFYSPEASRRFAELARAKQALAGRAVTFIAGGVHATAEPQETLAAGFDLVALGEGEGTIVELLKAAAAGEELGRVRGLGRLEHGLYRTTGAAEREGLDRWPAFNAPDGKFNPIEITRGCIYACAFCQTPFMFKARFRHRSVENVREHARIMRRERLRFVRFLTPTSLSYGADGAEPNLAAVEALLAAVREELGPEGKIYFGTFPSEVRPEHVTDEAMRLLARWVDNDNLVIGGQSGSQRMLDATRRDHGVDDVERAVRIAIAHGFRPNVDFLFGLPGEDRDDARATVDAMERLVAQGARVHAHTFMPLPGTPLKDAPAGLVDEEIQRAIARLESRGAAYGQWRRQLVAAASLRRRRSE